MRLHADTVAEDGAAAERTGWIDGDDTDGLAGAAELDDQAVDERALARAGRSGNANEIRAARVSEEPPDELGSLGRLVLDETDRAGHCARVALENALRQRTHWASSCRAITRRWISLVPSPMVRSLTSRKYFSAG